MEISFLAKTEFDKCMEESGYPVPDTFLPIEMVPSLILFGNKNGRFLCNFIVPVKNWFVSLYRFFTMVYI